MKPTRDGWYWARPSADDDWFVTEVYEHVDDGLIAVFSPQVFPEFDWSASNGPAEHIPVANLDSDWEFSKRIPNPDESA